MEAKQTPSGRQKTRIAINAVVTDGITEGSEEVFLPVNLLVNPPGEAFTTLYGKETIKVKLYQTDLLGELFKLRGIFSPNNKK